MIAGNVHSARPSRAVLMAAAVFAGLFLTSAAHANTKPFDGVVLVPPSKTETTTPQFKRGRIVDFQTRQKPGSIVTAFRRRRDFGACWASLPGPTSSNGFAQ